MDKFDPSVFDLEDHGWFAGAKPILPTLRVMSVGLMQPFSEAESRSDIFLKIFDDTIRRNMVELTNEQLRSSDSHGTGHSVTLPELQKFIAVRLMPRVDRRRELLDFWSPPENGSVTPNEWMKARMSHHRFCALNANVRFDHRQMLSAIVKNSLAMRDPGTILCWDESMILYLGEDCDFKVNPIQRVGQRFPAF